MAVTVQFLRESTWVLVIVVLWYSSHTAHWNLAQVHQTHSERVEHLERSLSHTQRRSDELVSTHCNLTALALKVRGSCTDTASQHQQLTEAMLDAREREIEEQFSGKVRQLGDQLDRARLALAESQRSHAHLERQLEQQVAQPQLPPSTLVPAGSRDPSQAWLVMGIPTVPRVNNEDFLLQVLESITSQLPTTPEHPMYGAVKVLVMNTHHAHHQRFEEAKRQYGAHSPHHVHVEFVAEAAALPDPFPGRQDQGNPNKPGFKVRKQTRNIVSVMRAARGRGQHFMFLEDDMLLCPNAMLAITSLLDRAHRYAPDWISVRASFGMNGIFMRVDDLGPFADYLIEHQARRPPDHLVVEWFAGETAQSAAYKAGRKHFGFRYNILDHLGTKSTLRAQKAKPMPMCYEILTQPILFAVEAFNPRACPRDDLWPCPAEPNPLRIDWVPIDSKKALDAKMAGLKHK